MAPMSVWPILMDFDWVTASMAVKPVWVRFHRPSNCHNWIHRLTVWWLERLQCPLCFYSCSMLAMALCAWIRSMSSADSVSFAWWWADRMAMRLAVQQWLDWNWTLAFVWVAAVRHLCRMDRLVPIWFCRESDDIGHDDCLDSILSPPSPAVIPGCRIEVSVSPFPIDSLCRRGRLSGLHVVFDISL